VLLVVVATALVTLMAGCTRSVDSKPVPVIIETGYGRTFVRTGCKMHKALTSCEYDGTVTLLDTESQVVTEAQALPDCRGLILIRTEKDSDEWALGSKIDLSKAWHLRLEINVTDLDRPPNWILFPPKFGPYSEGTNKPGAIAAHLCAIIRGVGATVG
jgi:hypothetical protein